MQLLINECGGTFTPQVLPGSPQTTYGIVVAAMNNDSFLDIFVGTWPS